MTSDDPTHDEPRDQVTDVLRGIIAQEAQAAGQEGAADRVRYLGDYELEEEIARGGMGVVFRARQVSLGRDVALKMILAGELAGDDAIARFRREAEAAARLQHPNIVAIHEVGEHEGLQYFSMDFVEGETLADVVARGPMPPKRAAELVRTIAEAVHYAHEQGTLHRDLKPANVLIDAEGRPRITDFGLARAVEVAGSDAGRTATGSILGTPSYMPPEQAEGNQALVGTRSDVYSLGAVLYELLTGRPPFRSDTPIATLRQVVDDEPASPRLLNSRVPEDLEAICLACLRKAPEQRYGSASELADDLGRFLSGRPIRMRASSSMSRLWRWCRRNPWNLTAIAAFGALALGGLAYFFWAENAYLTRDVGSTPRETELNRSWELAAMLMCVTAFQIALTPERLRRVAQNPLYLSGVFAGGLAGIAWGVYSCKVAIDSTIWAGEAASGSFYNSAFVLLGAWILTRVFYAYDRGKSGSLLELDEEQEDELFDLLKDGPKSQFGRRYRVAKDRYLQWTNADPLHADVALGKMWSRLRSVYPNNVPSKLWHRRTLVIAILVVAVGALFGWRA